MSLRKLLKKILSPKANLIFSQTSTSQTNTEQLFTTIYEDGLWGKSDDPNEKFFSGSGSHTVEIVNVYVKSIESFISDHPEIENAVDLGCGDFHVGSQLRPLFKKYIACDIVSPVIAHNIKKFAHLNVEFRHLDFTVDELPKGDVVFIRQVFQHLSNEKILFTLPKLCAQYKFLIITEHLPSGDFCENLDMPVSHHIRLGINSGLVLTKAPFNLAPINSWELCNAPEYGGIIRTIAYQIKP